MGASMKPRVLLVSTNRGIGTYTLERVQQLFPAHFKNFVLLLRFGIVGATGVLQKAAARGAGLMFFHYCVEPGACATVIGQARPSTSIAPARRSPSGSSRVSCTKVALKVDRTLAPCGRSKPSRCH